MTNITENTLVDFYKFLHGDTSLRDLESLVCRQTELERQFDRDVYLELIGFDFRDKNAGNRLKAFILKHLVHEGQFETWKLKSLLSAFLTEVPNLPRHLDQCYRSYCGVYEDDGRRKYAYKFMGNLGLNYLYWMDEGYLKNNYGDNWKKEYEKYLDHFGFYHAQLKPFAVEILEALNSGEIRILDDGTYTISEDLAAKLESETPYTLQHPELPPGHGLADAP